MTAITFVQGGAPIDVVTVPDVRQMLVDDAERTLSRSDLAIEVGDSFPNPTAPEGSVLAQAPLPGQEVSPGTLVRVILSQGQSRPTVPNVAAMPVASATQTLQASGFNVVVEEAPGEGSVGQVVGTVPGSGTSVALPATVRLRVGAPALPIPMPTLIGMLEDDAREAAESAGLTVSEVVYVESEFGEPGGVVGQEPPPGESIRPGSDVQLRVTRPGARETTRRDGGAAPAELARLVGANAERRDP
jgi:serine/threonine-protein kinase